MMSAQRLETVLKGLTILLHDIDVQQLPSIERQIISLGGTAVTKRRNRKKIDYVVVPFVFNDILNIKANIITYLWIEDCCNSVERVPVKYYHKPVTVSGYTPLKNCVISITNFSGSERFFLQKVSLLLGAHFQDELSRTPKLEENIKVTTHLICSVPEGQKYEGAVNWGVPIVSKKWLLKYVTSKQNLLEHELPSIANLIISMGCNSLAHNILSYRRRNDFSIGPTFCHSTCTTQEEMSTQDGRPELVLKGLTILLYDIDIQQLPYIERQIISLGGIAVNTQRNQQKIDYVVVPFVFNEKLNIKANIVTRLWIEDCCNNVKCVLVEYYHKPVTFSGSMPLKNCVITVTNYLDFERFFLIEVSLLLGAHYQDALSRTSKPKDNIRVTTHLICSIPEGSKYENAMKWDVPTVSKDWLLNCLMSKKCLSTDIFPVCNNDVSKMNESCFNTNESSPSNDNLNCSFSIENESISNLAVNSYHSSGSSRSLFEISSFPNDQTCNSDMSSSPKIDTKQQSLDRREFIRRTMKQLQQDLCTPRESKVSLLRMESQDNHANSLFKDRIIHSTQKCSVGWEDPTEEQEKARLERLTECNKKFTLTCMNSEDRKKYWDAIEKLGAQVLLSSEFCEDVTHVLMHQPSSSEKYLCSLASGKWILHPSYIDACLEKNCFLPEENYEWGNPLSELPLLTPMHGACFRWRSRISSGQSSAFSGMKVVLMTSDNKYQALKRLIQAGRGVILDKKELLNSTHCIVDQGYDDISVSLHELAIKGILLLPSLFLADLLIKDPAPDAKQCLISEYQALYNRLAPNA